MKELDKMEGMYKQLAFQMKLGAKPSFRGQTITGKLILVGYGHDKISPKFDYVNLSQKNLFDERELARFEKLNQNGLIQDGFYIEINEGKNDIELPIGSMVFVKQGFDYLASPDWKRDGVTNMIMNQLGKKKFEWFGQLSEEREVKTILPYMAIYFEPNLEDGKFFINEYSEHLIKD